MIQDKDLSLINNKTAETIQTPVESMLQIKGRRSSNLDTRSFLSLRSRSKMSSRSKYKRNRADISPSDLLLKQKQSILEKREQDGIDIANVIVEAEEDHHIDIEEKVLIVMYDSEETAALKGHCELHFTNTSLTFTNKDEPSMDTDNFDFIIIDLFGIADEDIDDNEEYYLHYGPKSLVWLIQEEEEELQEWIKDINPDAHFVEIGDEVEVEMDELKAAIVLGQKEFNKK